MSRTQVVEEVAPDSKYDRQRPHKNNIYEMVILLLAHDAPLKFTE